MPHGTVSRLKKRSEGEEIVHEEVYSRPRPKPEGGLYYFYRFSLTEAEGRGYTPVPAFFFRLHMRNVCFFGTLLLPAHPKRQSQTSISSLTKKERFRWIQVPCCNARKFIRATSNVVTVIKDWLSVLPGSLCSRVTLTNNSSFHAALLGYWI